MIRSWIGLLLIGLTSWAHAEPASLRLHSDPRTSWQARIDSIQNAQTRIEIEVFYLENDLSGRTLISELLRKKAQNPNLQIRLLLDGWGSGSFPESLGCALIEKGIEFKFFHRTTLADGSKHQERSHRKIWVTDNEAIVGGRNLSNENFPLASENVLTDYDLEVKGPLVEKIRRSFLQGWIADGSQIPDCRNVKADPISDTLPQADFGSLPMPEWQTADAEWFADIPGQRLKSRPVSQQVVKLLDQTQSSVQVESAFFLPWGDLAKSLNRAYQRNVNFDFYLNAVRSGSMMGEMSGCLPLSDLRSWLGRASEITVTSTKRLTHAKAFLLDDTVLGIGSFNWDARSIIWNAETLLVIRNSPALFDQFLKAHLLRKQSGQKISSVDEFMSLSGMDPAQKSKCEAYSWLRPLLGPFF